ncbi:hypothetical protein niasHT_014063 [Heterodera trifolii]|uniref:transketolase n=1 Tax=Heterodera trifolii TaxID=157864 RepID=A0ABD2LIL8_9BILA
MDSKKSLPLELIYELVNALPIHHRWAAQRVSSEFDNLVFERQADLIKIILQKANVSTAQAYITTMVQLANANENIVFFDGVCNFEDFFGCEAVTLGNRFVNYANTKQSIVDHSIVMTFCGRMPHVCLDVSSFSQISPQQLADGASANVQFVGCYSGGQLLVSDLALFGALQNSVVFCPSDAFSAERATQLATTHNGITYIRISPYPTPALYGDGDHDKFRIGSFINRHQSNRDKIVLVGIGAAVNLCEQAYRQLLNEKIPVTVLDMFSLKLTGEIYVSSLVSILLRVGRVVTVEEGVTPFCLPLASSILSFISEKKLQVSVRSLHTCGMCVLSK